MSTTAEKAKQLAVQEKEDVRRFNYQNNTHSKLTANSVGKILLRLWNKFHRSENHRTVMSDLMIWVNNLAQYFDQQSLTAFKEKQAWFLSKLLEYAVRKQPDLDKVEIFDPVTQQKHSKTIHMGQVLWSITRAISDEQGFHDQSYTLKDRQLGLYHLLFDYFENPSVCNAGVRNGLTQQLLHQRYRLHPGEPLVYVITSVSSDVHNLIAHHYADKLQSLLASPDPALRLKGLQLITLWIDDNVSKMRDEDEPTLRNFQNDASVLTAKITAHFKYLGLNPAEDGVEGHIKERVENRQYLQAPEPLGFVNAIQILTRIRQNPEKHAKSVAIVDACRDLTEIPVLVAPIKRIALLDRIEENCDIIPFGQYEGELITVGRRIEKELNELPSDLPHNDLFKIVDKLEDEFEAAITKARKDDDGAIMSNSFAMLKASIEHPTQFRQKIWDFVQRTKGILSDDRLRKILKPQIVMEGDAVSLNLSPLGVNSILWHAVRVSPADWSDDFKAIVPMLLVQLRKPHKSVNKQEWIRSSYPPELLEEMDWLLKIATDGEIRSFPPEKLYMPCNLSKLTVVLPEGPMTADLAVRFFYTPLQKRGWWSHLPNNLTLMGIPGFSQNPNLLRKILTRLSPTQVLEELTRSADQFAAMPIFIGHCFFASKKDMQWKIVELFWDKLSNVNRNTLLENLKGDREAFIETIEHKIRSFSQFISVLQHCSNMNSPATIEFIRHHLDKIVTHEQAKSVFSILHKNADSPEQLFAGFTLLTDRHPHSRKDFLKLVDDMHQFSIEHIKRNYTFLEAYLKRIKIWESTEDQNDRERYTQFLKDHTGKCLRREFFEGLTFEQHVELIPEGISLIEYLKCIPQGYQHMILIKYWKEISREELSACLSELPDDDRIFLSTITGQVTTYAQLVALKKRFTKLPEALYVQFATQYLQSVPIHALESVLKKLPQYDKKLLADIEKQTLQASARLKLIQHYPLASGDDAIAFIVRHLDCVIDPDCAYQVFSAFQAQSKKITSQRVIASRMEHQDILGAFAVLACHMPAAREGLLNLLGHDDRGAANIAILIHKIQPFCTPNVGITSFEKYQELRQNPECAKTLDEIIQLWTTKNSSKQSSIVKTQLLNLSLLVKMDRLMDYHREHNADQFLDSFTQVFEALKPSIPVPPTTRPVSTKEPLKEEPPVAHPSPTPRDPDVSKPDVPATKPPTPTVHVNIGEFNSTRTSAWRDQPIVSPTSTPSIPVESAPAQTLLLNRVIDKPALKAILTTYNAEKGFLRRTGWFHHAKRTNLIGDLWDLFEKDTITVSDIQKAFQKSDRATKPKNSHIPSYMDCLNDDVAPNKKHSATDRAVLAIGRLIRSDPTAHLDAEEHPAPRKRWIC